MMLSHFIGTNLSGFLLCIYSSKWVKGERHEGVYAAKAIIVIH